MHVTLTENRHDVLFQQSIHTKAQVFLHARRTIHHQLLTTQRTELFFITYAMMRNFSPKLNLELVRSIYPSSVLKNKMSLFCSLHIFQIVCLWMSSVTTSATVFPKLSLLFCFCHTESVTPVVYPEQI